LASTVDIVNGGLMLLGETLISSLTDATQEARLASSAWARVRPAVIRSHPWNSTTTRASLPKLTTTPAWGWAFEYQLPPDCLAVFDIDTDDSEQYWTVEARKLLADIDAPLGILYAKDELDSQVFDPLLVEALSHALALEMCEAITQSNTKRGQLHNLFNETMTRAKLADGQESSTRAFDEDEWILARLRR
jgi:hypothetical protein